MLTFYCYTDDMYDFRVCAKEVEANDMEEAAETYGRRLFDTGDFDETRPIPVIVAETRGGLNAVRFNVSRHVEVRHEVAELGEVEIPADEDGGPADA